ncbi:hypothetical protein BJ878DRAFT_543207 [Calycina marina]|uniref:Uncharacterized protein n=1 Tax=Calycina marina TaxID=1763456 RepID=A0A9P7Z1D2_9HELO|nr:hypothetical protein BJ878DRAFT_543207 [Calycina marina]
MKTTGDSEHPKRTLGGSWTLFNWRSKVIGIKTQRIDFADQLRQPQAEIGLEELLSFLLNLGAVPDPVELRILRASGLWVPPGTPLLLSPDMHEKVLTTGPLEDSNGHLSLSVRWSSAWAVRDQYSLSHYWFSLEVHGAPLRCPPSLEEKQAEDIIKDANDTNFLEEKKCTPAKCIPETKAAPLTLCCQIGLNGLISATPDDYEAGMFDSLPTHHLEIVESITLTTGIWFVSATTAFGTSAQTILWSYKNPPDIFTFAKKIL